MGKYKLRHSKVEDLILPGVTLRDIIDFNKFDLVEMSEKTGVSVEDIKALQVGEKQFTEEISHALANFIKLPEDFWLNLQKLYNEEKAKILRREGRMKKERAEQNMLLEEQSAKISPEKAKASKVVEDVPAKKASTPKSTEEKASKVAEDSPAKKTSTKKEKAPKIVEDIPAKKTSTKKVAEEKSSQIVEDTPIKKVSASKKTSEEKEKTSKAKASKPKEE